MAQPRYTEHSLLSRYLLQPSSLPTIVPIKPFLALHKSSSDPATAQALKKLYQDLQAQRNIDINSVRVNIDRECARGRVLKAKLRKGLRDELGQAGQGRKRKRGEGKDEDGEESVYISESENDLDAGGDEYDALNDSREQTLDTKLFGPTGAVLPPTGSRYHTTASLLDIMQQSSEDLKREIKQLDQESENALEAMQETVGGLSDLRYGKFSRVSGVEQGEGDTIESEVVEALRELTNAANRKSRNANRGKAGG